jgi:tetratricopeptide (TPR) repeat protein
LQHGNSLQNPGERSVAVEPTTRKQSPRSRKPSKPRASAGATRTQAHQVSTLESAQITVGNFLRATRERLKLTQAQVAERTLRSPWQLSRAAVSAIERGQNFPGLEAMLALSNVLHIDPKELIERARLTAVVPADVTGLSDDELEDRASQYFWAGDYKHALSVYDAMVQKLARSETSRSDAPAERLAMLEIRRATTLKRAGALISAIASTERAIVLATELPAIQAEAYVVLADLHCQRGHLPLASDAAERAIQLARDSDDPKTLAWAWLVKGRVLYLGTKFEEARQAFLEAREQATSNDDRQHLTHIEGNIGMCWLAQGKVKEAQKWIERAVERAVERVQPALEASWLVELGKIALQQDRADDADALVRRALRVAKPRGLTLTMFRAEWLRHRVAKRSKPGTADRQRLALLRELFTELDQHEGIEEINDFKRTILTVGSEVE